MHVNLLTPPQVLMTVSHVNLLWWIIFRFFSALVLVPEENLPG